MSKKVKKSVKKVAVKAKPSVETPKKVEPPVVEVSPDRCKYKCGACGKEFRSANIPPVCIHCKNSEKIERMEEQCLLHL